MRLSTDLVFKLVDDCLAFGTSEHFTEARTRYATDPELVGSINQIEDASDGSVDFSSDDVPEDLDDAVSEFIDIAGQSPLFDDDQRAAIHKYFYGT